jgi:hypothetical protein
LHYTDNKKLAWKAANEGYIVTIYTGFKDNLGRKIYVGDIVTARQTSGMVYQFRGDFYVNNYHLIDLVDVLLKGEDNG